MIDDHQIDEAIKRLALTGDGRLLHLRLQRKLMELCPNPHIPGALHSSDGERRFAARLKELMDSALEASGERAGESTTERPIIVARASGTGVASTGGARRRVPVDPE